MAPISQSCALSFLRSTASLHRPPALIRRSPTLVDGSTFQNLIFELPATPSIRCHSPSFANYLGLSQMAPLSQSCALSFPRSTASLHHPPASCYCSPNTVPITDSSQF
ncbi:hypothetical protein BDN71DRAFT_1459211 [Pleurotus eryngii]|uniref:Uncharacterized protein n=1 Tax=Pleurotus eryngii TaxID=5323 RepID=A0A9P5ZEI7_PLEER|nr:hypothetical protein BDN71DRAFT_1459211 [Pleurotus eryngii]